MILKFATIKFIISSVVFLMVCVCGCFFDVQASTSTVTTSQNADEAVRLKFIAVENETDNLEFQIFSGYNPSAALIFPQTKLMLQNPDFFKLKSRDFLVIKCSKGSFLPVFIQDGNVASGTVEDGYEGPFYLSMWMQYPQISESQKVHVRYALKKNKVGTIGIKIGSKGDYRFVAYENIKFIA